MILLKDGDTRRFNELRKIDRQVQQLIHERERSGLLRRLTLSQRIRTHRAKRADALAEATENEVLLAIAGRILDRLVTDMRREQSTRHPYHRNALNGLTDEVIQKISAEARGVTISLPWHRRYGHAADVPVAEGSNWSSCWARLTYVPTSRPESITTPQ